MEKLYINNTLASSMGIRMGEGFIDSIEAPVELKSYISNASRLLDGVQVVTLEPRKASRSLTLTFVVTGDTPEHYREHKRWLLEQFYKMKVDIKAPFLDGSPTFHLLYTGKSVTYAESRSHCSGTIAAGFDEPDPSNRV